MKKIEITYNPYKMITTMRIDGIDVCAHPSYDRFKTFIEQKTPLQSWIEPIPYLQWPGFVNALVDPDINDEFKVYFSGRKIDLEDFKRSIAIQNDARDDRTKVQFHYVHQKILNDRELSRNIDDVVQELKQSRFRALVENRKTSTLVNKYKQLDENYKIAKTNEFLICIAGMYSSGKSTLINALIRRKVLPTFSDTCTRINCHIKHSSAIGDKIGLTAFGKDGKILIAKQLFEDDEACAAAFEAINPADATVQGRSDVHMIELEMDLSHLYPESISKDKFTIVIVDTPGMDSAQSSNYGQNVHAEIAMDAISMKNKPMIVLCVDDKYEQESIGKFMREIVDQSSEDKGGFNDRFLFVINKCDTFTYARNESAEAKRQKFARYLTDPSRWGIRADEDELKELAEMASRFVPRIFMTSAGVDLAIQCGAHEYSDADLDDQENENRFNMYDDFSSKICGRRPRENYFLARYCDNPQYRKDELEQRFQMERDQDNEAAAVRLQCGLISVETAIRDYLERYAYPIKVRGLLDTFEDILEDVESFTDATLKELQDAQKKLGEKTGEREGAENEKRSIQEKIDALEKYKKETEEQLKELNNIVFNSTRLKRAIANFRAEIEANPKILRMRATSRINTGQKSRADVKTEIQDLIKNIREIFSTAYNKTNAELLLIKAEHDDQMNQIFNVLDRVVHDLEKSDILGQGKYNFKNTVFWKDKIAPLDSSDLEGSMMQKVVDKQGRPRNQRKQRWSTSWNPFKRIASWFMDDYDYSVSPKDGYYDTTPITTKIGDYLYSLNEKTQEMETSFQSMLDNRKELVRNLINELLLELNHFLADIETQKELIDALSSSIKKLDLEIKAYHAEHEWLEMLQNKIKGE